MYIGWVIELASTLWPRATLIDRPRSVEMMNGCKRVVKAATLVISVTIYTLKNIYARYARVPTNVVLRV